MNVRTAVSSLAAMLVLTAICAEPEPSKSVVEFQSEKNELKDIALPKGKSLAEITLRNSSESPCLWILARACDKRKIEHCPGGMLKIEVNGTEMKPERSLLQGSTYRAPLHPAPRSALADNPKYREACPQRDEDSGWFFKYDVDFVMNNQLLNLPKSNWGVRYATDGFNYWYAFDVKGVATEGGNKVSLHVLPEILKNSNYDGFMIGAIAFGNLEDMKRRVADYEKLQTSKIDPEKMYTQAKYEKDFDKTYIPESGSQRFESFDGYIHRDGKPFFMAYANPCIPDNKGRDGIYQIYNYYGLVNAISAGDSFRTYEQITDLPIYLKPGWDKYQPSKDEIRTLLHETNMIYENKILAVLYSLALYHTGKNMERSHPEILSQTVDGKWLKGEFSGGFGNFTSPAFQEYVRQMHTVMGKTFKNHSGVWGISLWEELGWRTNQAPKNMVPQNQEDLKRYQEWLKAKYVSIEALNKEWETRHDDFQAIKFPEWREQTGNFANFQTWRTEAVVKCAEIAYDSFKQAAPDKLALGQKTYGDVGLGSWYWSHAMDNWAYTKYTDVSREYSGGTAMAHLGRASCDAFGKTMEADICLGEDLYRIWDAPEDWHKPLDRAAVNVYPDLMNIIFNGNKAIHWEVYDTIYLHNYHFIHYGKRWKQEALKTWDGKPVRFKDAGTADVIVPEKTLRISRLHQWAMRNASLILPAKVVTPQIAVLMSNSSRLIGYDTADKLAKTKKIIQKWQNNAGQDFNLLGNLFDNMHLKFDVVDDRRIDDIFKYKTLIVGFQANVGSQAVADKIKEFAEKGGTVIFYPEAMSMRDVDFHYDKKSPGFGLDELCGTSIDNKRIVELEGLKTTDSEVFSGKYYAVKLNVNPDGVTLATDFKGNPVLVSGKNKRCYYFGGYLGLAYFKSHPNHEQFTKLIEGLLLNAGVTRPLEVKASDATADRRLLLPGMMKGDGYYLASVGNFTGKDQSVKMKINGLPDNVAYEMVDISGERPLMEQSSDGNFHLKPNFEEVFPRYVLNEADGVNLDVPSSYSKVILIRPAGMSVWMNCTKDALLSYVKFKKPLKIVYGQGYEKEALKLSGLLTKRGLTVSTAPDSQVRIKTVEGRLADDGYELERYRHSVLDTDVDLVLIGNAEENKAVGHLQTPGNYVYCKMPEMTSASYPGKGRGVIQIAECVNAISYDPTGAGKDAIVLAGSDREGTMAAIVKFMNAVKEK